jgi:hypothetical protein
MRVTTDRLKARAEQLKKDGVRIRSNAEQNVSLAEERFISEAERSDPASNDGNDEKKIAGPVTHFS